MHLKSNAEASGDYFPPVISQLSEELIRLCRALSAGGVGGLHLNNLALLAVFSFHNLDYI